MSSIELTAKSYAGRVRAVEAGSLAEALGLRPGDELLRVNGHAVEDVIDVQFYAAEDEVALTYRRDGAEHTAQGEREPGQPLGLEFEHPTFDIDIRRCNNLCPFCFVLQTAPRMRRTLYIKDDDYRYSFLYGHFVTLTNLGPHDWERIEQQHLSPLYVSVHSTDLENRRACLANPKAPDVLAQLRWLAERGIEAHTQLVITPGLNDGAWLDRSLRDLAELYPAVQSVSVVPVGLTRHHKYGHRPHSREEAAAVLAQVERWQAEFLERFGVRFAYPTDEWFLATGRPVPPLKYYDGMALEENGLGMVRRFLDEWRRVKRELGELGEEGELGGTRKGRKTKDEGRRPAADGRSWMADRRSQTEDEGRTTKDEGGMQQAEGGRRNAGPQANPPYAIRRRLQGRRGTLVTATLFGPTLERTAAEFNARAGTDLRVRAVVNERLGHTITVAGLLMGQDVLDQLRPLAEAGELGELVVLPRVMFDHPQGISLDDISPLQIAQGLNAPVFLADGLGDVLDALTGANTLRFDPRQAAIPLEVMRAGGWAVEKYL